MERQKRVFIFSQWYVTGCIYEKSFGLGTCKVVASNFPTEINSNGNNFNRPKKVYLKPTLRCTYVNTAKGNIRLFALKKGIIITATT